MSIRRILACALALAVLAASAPAQPLSPLEQLGKLIFFDTTLSDPQGMSCATCHAPQVGFTGPDAGVNLATAVYPGAVVPRYGNRRPPAAAYAGASPLLHWDAGLGGWFGGMFYDGRATGWTLGDPLAEQAQGPFLNPLEMNNANAAMVCQKIHHSRYAGLFEAVWGPGSSQPDGDAAVMYERVARSIAAYEASAEANPFTAKYDRWLAGEAALTDLEAEGLALFEGRAGCAGCHPTAADGGSALFTTYGYANLGLPRSERLPFYTQPPRWNPDGAAWVDPGLAGFLAGVPEYADAAAAEYGKHKIQTLRNVDRRPAADFAKAYGHNGVFISLAEFVHFLNTRDSGGWAVPEVAANLSAAVGDLGLTAGEEAALVAFLGTLSDGWTPPDGAKAMGVAAALPSVSGPGVVRGAVDVRFSLPAAADMRLEVFDLRGRRVAVLAEGWREAGAGSAAWRAADLPSGLYLLRLTTAAGGASARCVVVH
ncbi:MAG TPA: cytochrome c peroxidase [Candidatus Krumholzibacteria bacterium]|nr:cytochrome c peroxidase [Candidatus Krumholzibacteria bacterium]